MRRTATALVIPAICLLIPAAPLVRAQPDAPTVDELVARLGAEHVAQRDAAALSLLAASGATEEFLARQLERRDLGLEQRLRLERCLKQRFIDSPRGGMGVGFASPGVGALVVIDRLVDGFPVAEQNLLRPGDVFVEVAGDPIEGQTGIIANLQVIRRILSFDPGDLVPIRIFRPVDPGPLRAPGVESLEGIEGEYLDVLVPLGRRDELGNPTPPAPEYLDVAWEIRMQRLGVEVWRPQSIRPGIAAVQWGALGLSTPRRTPYFTAASPPVDVLAAIGARRTNEQMLRADALRARQDEQREQLGIFRGLLRGERSDDLLRAVEGDHTRRAEALRLIQQIVEYQEIRQGQEENLNAGPATARDRELLQSHLRGTDAKLRALHDQLVELVGDAPNLGIRDER